MAMLLELRPEQAEPVLVPELELALGLEPEPELELVLQPVLASALVQVPG